VRPAASSPSQRVTFGIEPASATGADGRPDLSLAVTPGAVLQDHVAVLDYSVEPLTLTVSATDAIETPAGGYSLLPPGKRPSGVGAWISLPESGSTVRVPARTASGPGQVVVPLLVRVPASATPGDHAGGVVASLTTEGRNATGQNVVLVQRIGTRVFVRVAGALKPGLSITRLHSSYAGTLNPIGRGEVHATYTLRNIGNTDLGVQQSVSVSGLFGAAATQRLKPISLLLPGASLQEQVEIGGVLPTFRLHSTVTLRAVAPPGGASPNLGSLTSATGLWAVPWGLVFLVVLLVAVLVAFLTRKRWARRWTVAKAEVASP
jgi:hypothetical protein